MHRVNVPDAGSLHSPLRRSGPSPAAASGRLDDQEIVPPQRERDLGRERLSAALSDEPISPRPAVFAALQAPGSQGSSLGEDRCRPSSTEEPDGPTHAIASRETAGASRAGDEAIFLDAAGLRGRTSRPSSARTRTGRYAPAFRGASGSVTHRTT